MRGCVDSQISESTWKTWFVYFWGLDRYC